MRMDFTPEDDRSHTTSRAASPLRPDPSGRFFVAIESAAARKHPMRHAMPLILLGSVMGCASLTPQGAHVKVYEADLAAPANSRSLPEGCRRLSVAGPIEQMESERHISDPYRIQRNETGERGGNVLLVLSSA